MLLCKLIMSCPSHIYESSQLDTERKVNLNHSSCCCIQPHLRDTWKRNCINTEEASDSLSLNQVNEPVKKHASDTLKNIRGACERTVNLTKPSPNLGEHLASVKWELKRFALCHFLGLLKENAVA